MPTRELSRRSFLKLSAMTALRLSVAGAGALGYSALVEPSWLEVVRLRLKLAHLAPSLSGMRLLQLSDLHMGGWMNRERLRTVVAHALAQEPDLAVVTGDFVVAHTRDEDLRASVQELVAELSVLAEQQPTLAVLGNHDYWTNAEAVRAGLMATGILELRNEVYTFSKAGGRLHVAGVDDVWEGQHRLGAVLEQLPADGATVLLAHEPDFADESAKTGRFDLQLSGHSHGGQVVLPLLGPPALPWLGRKYPAGSYQVGQMQLYTNRGVGMIAPYVRFNCRPEITVFTLESTEPQLAEPARDA